MLRDGDAGGEYRAGVTSGAAHVRLRAMTLAEFDDWKPHSIEAFAGELARAVGRPLDAAMQRAVAQFDDQLPDGLQTPGTWLLNVENDAGDRVGIMWLGRHPSRPGAGYVYDIEIEESERGRGYGRAAMLAAEDVLRSAGFSDVGLSVFGFNHTAKQLYDSIGYRTVATQMVKSLT